MRTISNIVDSLIKKGSKLTGVLDAENPRTVQASCSTLFSDQKSFHESGVDFFARWDFSILYFK